MLFVPAVRALETFPPHTSPPGIVSSLIFLGPFSLSLPNDLGLLNAYRLRKAAIGLA